MNIRNRIIETYIPGYSIEVSKWVEGGLFSNSYRTTEKVYVPSRDEEKTVMEYLNPETTKWEPIPEKREYITIDRPASA